MMRHFLEQGFLHGQHRKLRDRTLTNVTKHDKMTS